MRFQLFDGLREFQSDMALPLRFSMLTVEHVTVAQGWLLKQTVLGHMTEVRKQVKSVATMGKVGF
jgi:hypothetical protein